METPQTLDEVLAHAEAQLAAAGNDWRHPMHQVVVATADADQRIMVLRDYDAETRTLRFHTDARAPKVSVIAAEPAVGLLLYDHDGKLQLRCKGVARIERDGPVANAAWAAATNFAKRCYLAPQPPSSAADGPTSNLPADLEGVAPDDDRAALGRENFAVLLVTLTSLDWFSLSHEGHRRAAFRFAANGTVEASWLAP